ncbi:MAG TPA: peroxidase family protein [Nocardioidaceae bacterium]|nr:peroxidase family protein [Nocardioidaceae bacterium]
MPRRHVATVTALTVAAGLVPTAALIPVAANAAPVGQGFHLSAGDLRFILKQIKISEHHATNFNPQDPCAGLVGPGPNQIPEGGNTRELPWGLRTVNGSCNNLMPGQSKYGAADQTFPRAAQGELRDAEDSFDVDGPFGPAQAGVPSSYKQSSGDVFDSGPRVVSNLIVDQTKTNPAALAAAGIQDPTTVQPGESLSIPNVAPDVGLSAPFNSVFTLFGQFFDHGLDLVGKGGNGTIYMPLKQDDPLYVEGGHTNFMVLSRSTVQAGPGPDGQMGTSDDTREAVNLTTPFVDQNQTYSSHPSQQVFLREYANGPDGRPLSTGELLEAPDGGMATWADLKAQARDLLGVELSDQDALSVPLLATDPYGEFERGPNGYPQLVLTDGTLLEGNPADPVPTDGPLGTAVPTGHAFLVDIAHHAVPFGDPSGRGGPGQALTPDDDPGTTADRLADGRPNSATYDDEMLGEHFMAGDGRVNENIGLTSIHHIFHAEHNRLNGHIKDVLTTEASDALEQEYQLGTDAAGQPVWDGERLFQAAKFVTEMEYQHLAFEEFARKVQPMVNAFGEGGTGYNTSVNPAIRAEFAHAVYRFGHSMLTETVARRGRPDDKLLDVFLNPPSYDDSGALSPEQAAGSILAGMSRQVGNEIDEFVTGALRSNLLGLPLDLAAINIARARETGVPSLNEARRQFYAASNDTSLKPYESWTDFGFNLKHRESLVNFVAAYGTHPSISGNLADRRAAAARIVANDLASDPATPEDSGEFMSSTGTWENVETGLNTVDLWVGGLAEKQMVFGGLLGSTFNYVFELQMEDLQFGDRFYYLSRTAGLNLLTQLEGNSFAELIHRNTDAQALPADVFSRPDYVFHVGNLGPANGPIVDDAETTDYNEADRGSEPGMHLSWLGGVLRYDGPAHTVFNGTAGNDRLRASEGDDTIRGNDGNDRMEGGDGVDSLIGGLGDDILTDLNGDDTLKGGDGNDALSSGKGFGGDLNQGGRGKDFIVNGNDLTEAFAGPGDDFVLGGDDLDTVFGDEGDDWIEGGAGPFNLLQGDNGNPFANDPDGGHDVLDGDGGEQDFDAEGGDDIMLMGPGIQRAEGMLGFDWTTHKGDPQPADSDMGFTGLLPPTVGTLRDRFDLVEGLSGWKHDDVLRGDGGIPQELEGITTPEDHKLTEAGINRIQGLADLLPDGATSYSKGNIILGGGGSDTMEGRGGDDIIHGDAWLDVSLRVPDLSTPNNLADTTLVDGMRSTALVENGFNRTLEQLVFAGRINPGDISIVRRVRPGTPGDDIDVAVFSDIRSNYDCQLDGDPAEICSAVTNTEIEQATTITVTHVTVPPGTEPEEDAPDDGVQNDGIDTLTNVERLVFSDTRPPSAPSIGRATAGNRSATVTWSPPTVGAVEGYRVQVVNADGNPVGALRETAAGTRTLVVNGLQNGQAYRFRVQAWNIAGDSTFSALSNAVTPSATVPAAPAITDVEPGNQRATVHWTAPDNGGTPITGYQVRVSDAADTQIGDLRSASATANRLTVTGLRNGEMYWFEVRAANSLGNGDWSAPSTVTPATSPAAAQIGTAAARSGAAVVQWLAPVDDGGLGITGFRIRVIDAAGSQVGALRNANVTASRLRVGGLSNGNAYRFQVAAVNAMGTGRFSRLSAAVVPGTRPKAPVVRRPATGHAGGPLTATARWSPPPGVTLPGVTSYAVTALRMESRAADAQVLRRYRSPAIASHRRALRFRLRPGIYRFQVMAWNSRGRSAPSTMSRPVRAR